jgi:teichoic acid transport system ATP-binding protein
MNSVTASTVPESYPGCADSRRPLVDAADLGVRYKIGAGREDVQSLTYNALFRRRKENAFWALRHINLVGYAGEVLGVIGANGMGKTTLCRVLCGLLRPDEGSLNIAGQVSALLSLEAGFNDQLSGRENIFLKGMMLGLSRLELKERCPEIIAL